MQNSNLKFKTFFLIFFFKLLLLGNSHSEILKKFNIVGNDRVSNETIIMFSKLNIGMRLKNKLNKTLKELYYTDYFKDVSLNLKNGTLNISVKENPIIQTVIITGVDKKNINEKLRDLTSNIEKYPFIENKINDQVILIKNILKSNGYYFVKVQTSLKKNDNNTIDLIYDINLGDVAKIKKVTFIGKKIFRDNTLRNVILSEESKFWKILTNNKFLDTNRITVDISRLNKFYKNRGYFNVKIKSTTAIITDQNQFELIFNINSGEKYFLKI